LVEIGVKEFTCEERTYLAYLRKTIIPNATNYITSENAITIDYVIDHNCKTENQYLTE
jgi:hypothetical protein